MSKRVLIVDDSDTLRKLVVVSLKVLRGCEVTEAASAVEALRLLKEQDFDLVITDIRMPEMSGLQLLGFIKRDPRLQRMPVVILTTEGGEEDRRRGMALGADRYLVKPFKPRALVQIVQELLERSEDVASSSEQGQAEGS